MSFLPSKPKLSQQIGSQIRRQMESKKGEETPCLPDQIITEEILPRLQAKSLLRFRCVSKSWNSLIGSKRFIKAHLKNSIKSSAHCWIFYDDFKKGMMQCSLLSLFDNRFTTDPSPITYIADLRIDSKYKRNPPVDLILPVGCCNGLVCILVNWKRFILWNPTTKKFNNLPNFYNQIKEVCGSLLTYGFGFDELGDDYKVIGIVGRCNAKGCIGMIYSLKSNSWKPIEKADDDSPFNTKIMDMGVYVSGKLHWYSYECDIVSFDLNSHVCGVLEPPSYTYGNFHSMGVIGGCLTAHITNRNWDLDVWMMKEYGMKESWDKVVTVPYYNHLKNPIPKDFYIPTLVAITPNGEFLLIHNKIIMIYNPKSDVLRYPQITSFDDGFTSLVRSLGIYIGSLVSVAPDAHKK